MKLCFLSCGIYRPELDCVLAELKQDSQFDCELSVSYLPPRLHIDFSQLKNGIVAALEKITADQIIWLYGAKCHPEFHDFLHGRNVIRFSQSNCIELILGERMRTIDSQAKTIYLTPGWALYWHDFSDPDKPEDPVAVRNRFRGFDQLLFADTGSFAVPAEKLTEIAELTGLPLKVEQVGIDTFRRNINSAICRALADGGREQ